MTELGRILVVNLTDKTTREETWPEEAVLRYLGGRGLGAYLLARFLPARTDPLGEDNALIFSTGPLQGTQAPFSSKTVLTCKSPLTGIYLYTLGSSTLGHEIVRCGYQALVILGRLASPGYLWIRDGQVEFRSAQHFWDAQTLEAQSTMLSEAADRDAATAAIGPAGVKLVRFANVLTGGPKMRTFGRGGAGAVMGSKQLKGLVIRGTRPRTLQNAEGFREAVRTITRAIAGRSEWAQKRRRLGTTTSLAALQEYGMLPTRNWQREMFDGFDKLAPVKHSGEEPWKGESISCAPLCPAPCAREYTVTGGEYAAAASQGPDYETLYALGSNCGIDRFDALVAADRLCDELGMDSMSAGGVVGFAMECYERGLIGPAELGEVDLRFGNHAALIPVLQCMARREGFGNLLAQGVKRCAEVIGRGSEAFAMHAKGLELGGWGCRGAYGQALQYALGSRGGCHHDLGLPAKVEYAAPDATTIPGKGKLVLRKGAERMALDSAIVCSFAEQYVNLGAIGNLISSIIGVEWSPETLMEVGERILNLERLINIREGVGRAADQLPRRLLDEPLPDGPRRGSTVPLEQLKTEFYATAGWDMDTGIPLPGTLARLDLGSEIVERLDLCYLRDSL
jgi:aldehyde:ferredoxin oxidoreductase